MKRRRQAVTLILLAVAVLLTSVNGAAQFDFPFLSPPPLPPPQIGSVATGTGFVVHPDGYILTNEHVIHDAVHLSITVGDSEYEPIFLGSDELKDLALLKIDAHNLPAISLGNSDSVGKGDTVYAIGCPRGICGTVTQGRVANIGVNAGDVSFIMMDLTITHGSSGGPLLNSRGEVIGITSAVLKSGSGEGESGFSFAIPINDTIPFLRQIPGFAPASMGQATEDLSFSQIESTCGPATAYVEADRTRTITLPEGYVGPVNSNPCLGFLCSVADHFKDSVVGGIEGSDEGSTWEGPEFQYNYTDLSGQGWIAKDNISYSRYYGGAVLQARSTGEARSVMEELMRKRYPLASLFSCGCPSDSEYCVEKSATLLEARDERNGILIAKNVTFQTALDLLGFRQTEGQLRYYIVGAIDNILICFEGVQNSYAEAGEFQIKGDTVVLHLDQGNSNTLAAASPYSYDFPSDVDVNEFMDQTTDKANAFFEYIIRQFQ